MLCLKISLIDILCSLPERSRYIVRTFEANKENSRLLLKAAPNLCKTSGCRETFTWDHRALYIDLFSCKRPALRKSPIEDENQEFWTALLVSDLREQDILRRLVNADGY